jgi:hypothetical protein
MREEETNLGLVLPPSFREWISLASELTEKDQFENIFRDYYEVIRLEEASAVTLMVIAEGDSYWAVMEENLILPDPPTDSYGIDFEYTGDEERFIFYSRESHHISIFILRYLAWHMEMHSRGWFIDGEVTDDLLTMLKNSFPVWSSLDDIEVFEKANIIAILFRDVWREAGNAIFVKFWQPVAKEEIPECLYERLHKESIASMLLPA